MYQQIPVKASEQNTWGQKVKKNGQGKRAPCAFQFLDGQTRVSDVDSRK